MALLDGPRAAPASGQPARQLVVLLHGVGADGADLIGLTPLLAQALPDAAFVAPNAPEPCDMAPFGYQWFSLQDRQPAKILAGVQAATPLLDAFLDAELETLGLTDDRMALLGFSQGTMMALYTAPRRPRACAAVLGYSGALVGADLLRGDIRSRPPVLLIHGDADTIVPVGASALAEQALTAAGVPAQSRVRPGLAHGIDPEGIALGAAFLKQHLVG